MGVAAFGWGLAALLGFFITFMGVTAFALGRFVGVKGGAFFALAAGFFKLPFSSFCSGSEASSGVAGAGVAGAEGGGPSEAMALYLGIPFRKILSNKSLKS